MIIKGKFRSFGFWFSLSSVFFGICILFYCFIFGLGNISLEGQIFFYGVLIILICVYCKLLYDANLITIDTEVKKIIFENKFTRIRSTNKFSDFDGKLIVYKLQRGYTKNYYIIKNKKVVKKISGFIYSNQKELGDALSDIKDLGAIKYSYLISWKVFFGYPILD